MYLPQKTVKKKNTVFVLMFSWDVIQQKNKQNNIHSKQNSELQSYTKDAETSSMVSAAQVEE